MPVTVKQLRAATWRQVYSYDGIRSSFRIFATDAIPSMTVTHERFRHSGRTAVLFRARGRTTDSPTQAVRYWNEEERRALNNT